MEQLVRVKQVFDDGTAQVIRVRESACSGDCHKCSGCGAAKQTMLLDAVNAIGAKPGELVILQSETAPVLKAAVVLYMLPLVLFFLGYILGETGGYGPMAGGVGFLAGILLVVVYDRKVARKQEAVYTITGYPEGQRPKTIKKGDNDLD